MKADIALLVLWIALAVICGLLFFWLFPLKLLSRLAARFGKSAPCPASLTWLVDNPIRRRYMRPVLDRVGIRPGERVLELGPGPGTFTVDAARRVGPKGQLIAVDIRRAHGAEYEAYCARTGRYLPRVRLAEKE